MSSKSSCNNKTNYLKYLFQYFKKYKVQMIYMIVALLVTSSSVLLLSQNLKYIIDGVFSKNEVNILNNALIYQMLIIASLSIGTAFRYYFTTYIGENVINDVRKDLYDKVLELSPAYYEINKSGDVISKITSDTTIIQSVIGSSLSIALRNIVMLLGALIMMIATSFKLSCFLILIIPCVIIPIIFMGRKVKKYSKLTQEKVGDLAGWVDETVNFISTIQSYTREDTAKKQYENRLSKVLGLILHSAKIKSTLIFLVIALVFSGIIAVLWIGSYYVLYSYLTPGDLSAFIFLAIIAAGSIGGLTEIISDLQKAGGACERITDFLSIKPSIRDKKDAFLINDTKCVSIVFEKVSFAYHSKLNNPALQNLTFKIYENEKIAIIGKSGAGKSTIFKLLLRFYDIEKGKIVYNGYNIKDIKLQSLRSQFAYVSQDPIIFSTSVHENILYGNPDATDDEVQKAAADASALEFIKDLPQGFNTFLGEKGVRISGGQKQRIALARAILKDPKVLLLDEATSALDSHNEKILQNALKEFSKNRVTIIIAHRLSTIVHADRIFIFDNGKIIAEGTHNTLKKENSYYKEIVYHQKTF